MQLGREKLLKEGHNGIQFTETKFVNTREFRGKFGQGIDDVLQGSDGNLWVVEYKGGEGELTLRQMKPDWVRRKITELQRDLNPWGDKLKEALDKGELRGIAVSTPYKAGTGAGETKVIGTWRY